jgi:hypothetical protein
MRKFIATILALTLCFASPAYAGVKGGQAGDSATGAAVCITYPHHEVHAGSSYVAHFDNTTSSDDDHRTGIGIETSATAKWMHLTVTVTASSPAEFFMYEAPTINDDVGTQTAIYNRDRNSGNVSLTTDISAAPTAGKFEAYIEANLATLSGGTVIEHALLAGGDGPKAIGGMSRGSQEWILDAGVKYVFVLQNIGASENLHEIHLDWYEHTNKN